MVITLAIHALTHESSKVSITITPTIGGLHLHKSPKIPLQAPPRQAHVTLTSTQCKQLTVTKYIPRHLHGNETQVPRPTTRNTRRLTGGTHEAQQIEQVRIYAAPSYVNNLPPGASSKLAREKIANTFYSETFLAACDCRLQLLLCIHSAVAASLTIQATRGPCYCLN